MHVLTLKLPDDLNAALQEVSTKRGLSKSAIVREALEKTEPAFTALHGSAIWKSTWMQSAPGAQEPSSR